jgi:hypothetical protein
MDIAQIVRDTIEGALWPHERAERLAIPFGETVEWKEGDCTITFHGTSVIQDGFAIYQGQWGKWQIALAPRGGSVANPQRKPCSRTSGKAIQLAEIGKLKYGYEEQIRGLPPMPAPPDAEE